MHKNLGVELFSIGWDFMIVDDEPVFIEFNINNGFYVAEHTSEEVYATSTTNFEFSMHFEIAWLLYLLFGKFYAGEMRMSFVSAL